MDEKCRQHYHARAVVWLWFLRFRLLRLGLK
jgi:hypothetical protein